MFSLYLLWLKAFSEIEDLDDKIYKEALIILQLMNENLANWRNELSEEQSSNYKNA
jgi:hypothetical protein